jgi:hypothetical protein
VTLASPEVLNLEDLDWRIGCEHPRHPGLLRGHSDDSPVLAVRGIPLECCGLAGRAHFLCASWVAENPYLRCPKCGTTGILFEHAYEILGPA